MRIFINVSFNIPDGATIQNCVGYAEAWESSMRFLNLFAAQPRNKEDFEVVEIFWGVKG